MEKDKRPFYIWLIAILANIGAYLTLVILQFIDKPMPSLSDGFLLGPDGYGYHEFLVSGVSFLVMSIIAVAVAQSELVWKKRIAFGIIALLLVPLLYFILYSMTCRGSLCGLTYASHIIYFGTLLFAFGMFYTISVYFRKWSIKFALSVLWVEAIAIIGGILFLVHYVYTNQSLLLVKINEETEPTAITEMCDRFAYYNRHDALTRCWNDAITAHPEVGMCSLSKNRNSQITCDSVIEKRRKLQ